MFTSIIKESSRTKSLNVMKYVNYYFMMNMEVRSKILYLLRKKSMDKTKSIKDTRYV